MREPGDNRGKPAPSFPISLGEPVPGAFAEHLEQDGGARVPVHNPYWDTWGVTLPDPDGCLLVLSTRTWSSSAD
ncbi:MULTISPECIES: hypothetical protein [Streptomyces]|uniref:hypothetical protein n=1 Tax=Streptomyces TaxID=1883 RepID=UPI0026D663F7